MTEPLRYCTTRQRGACIRPSRTRPLVSSMIMLGLEISHGEGQSVYMRAYEDFYQYTLKITERDKPGLEEITWRAKSAEALTRVAETLEGTGQGARAGRKTDYAHGPAYKFTTPDGHCMKVLWELDYFDAPPDMASKLKSRPSKRPAAWRSGAAAGSRQHHGE